MSTYSNWREDLIEVIDTPTTETKALKKVKETKVKNKVVINPKLDEAVKELGGELLEVKEVDDKSGTGEDPQIKSKEKRQAMIKRQVLLKKLQAVRAGGGADITAGYEPEGEIVEDYETKKTGEVLAAFKRDPKVRKRFEKAAKKEDGPGSVKNRAADSMLQTAKDTAKRKGDTSKSDDRYAYEEVQLEAKVDKGRSDYGKASIRNYRRSGPGHGEPAMFDSENKRGKTIDKRREEHKARRGVKGAKVPAYKKESYEINPAAHKAAQKKTKMRNLAIGNENPNEKAAAEKKAGGPKLVGEGVMKMVKRVIRGKKVERKPQKAIDAGAVARRKLQQKDHETVNFLPMNESDKPEKDISKINEKKRKNALQIQKVIGEDKGFDYVLAKLKAKHGDGVLTKGDKIKPPSAAQKKKNAKIMAQRAKQDGRDATEKASDGRYNDRSRSD